MERIKKLLSVLLVATMVFTTFSMGISVSAENVSTETSGTSDSPLKVEVITDKSNYGTFGVSNITVKVTNTSDKTVENISAEANFYDLAPVGRKSETSKEVESLNAGESFSFSYKATVSLNNSNLGFFEKFILWFVQLFNGGITSIESKTQEAETYIEYSTAITFGNIATNNIIRINGKANDIGAKVLSVSEKEFNTSTEKVNVYFYVKKENLSNDIILKCKEDENISIKLLDNGDHNKNGDMQKNDNIYTGKFELNCEKEAEYNFYATSDNLKTNSVKINIIEPFSDSELDEMEIVDNAFVELKSSSDYKNSTEDEKKEKIQKLINELVSNGLIIKNTVIYDNNLKQFYFQYKCEIDCYINVNEIKYESIFTDTTISTINLGRSVNRMLNSKSSFDNSKNNALFLCGATGANQNDILLKVDTMNKLGLQTTVNFSTSVSTYKYALLGYDLITIIEHGQEFLNSNTRALALNEKVTKSKNDDYCNDIDQKRVKKVDGHYCIMPEFFSFYYEDKLEGVFVSLASCESFGKNGKEDYNFAYELYEHCGVKCVLGYHNSVYMDYGIDFSYYYVNYLFLGAKSKEALDYAIEKCGNNDVEYVYKNLDRADEKVIKDAQKKEKNGKSAYPIITSYYTNPFDFGTFSVAIKENSNKVKNANAKVFWIENSKELLEENPNKHFEYNLKTDENGLLSQKLPIGNYGCIVNSEYTDKKYFTFIIEKDVETVVLNPVYLTPTTYLMGTVIDKSTNKPVENASVLLRLQDGNSGLYTNEYTCSTDENGQFEINVPAGTYTYEINKLNLFEELYETATGTTTVNSATANIIGTVYLTPKNSSGGGSEENIFSGGDGTEENPYQVSTPEQLNAVRNNLSAHYIQTVDIDMSNWGNWEPIGKEVPCYSYTPPYGKPSTERAPFVGSFNGNNFSILNLEINNSENSPEIDCYGLFAGVENAVIENVNLKQINYDIDKQSTDYATMYANEYVTYSVCVGGIVGKCSGENTVISNCNVSGTISVVNCNSAFIGGITGYGSNITSCINKTDIYANANKDSRFEKDSEVCCGGIVGHTDSINGIVSKSMNYGCIEVIAGNFGYIGGISGEYGKIENCVNLGKIKGSTIRNSGHSTFAGNCNVGGIVGATSSDYVRYCINYGSVCASSDYYMWSASCYSGGIVGYCGYYGSGKIYNCINNSTHVYSTKLDNSGGIVNANAGRIAGCSNYIEAVYSNNQTLVNNVLTDGTTSDINGESSTAEQLLSPNTYIGFDFENTWKIDTKIGGAILR